MFAEPGITMASQVVTSFQLLITAALLLCAAAVLTGYRRDLKATLRQSAVTENLSRIASALERIANQPADFSIREAARRSAEKIGADAVAEAEPASEAAHRVAYSIFGR